MRQTIVVHLQDDHANVSQDHMPCIVGEVVVMALNSTRHERALHEAKVLQDAHDEKRRQDKKNKKTKQRLKRRELVNGRRSRL